MTKSFLPSLAATTACLMAASSANAAVSFDFVLAGGGFYGSGVFTSTLPQNADGSYQLTGATGTITDSRFNNGVATNITGLSYYNGADNKIWYLPNNPDYPNFSEYTLAGVSVMTDGVLPISFGIPTYNFFSYDMPPMPGYHPGYPLNQREIDDVAFLNPNKSGGSGTITLYPHIPIMMPAPEPATWAMFIIGFGAIGAGMRRRSGSTSVSFARA